MDKFNKFNKEGLKGKNNNQKWKKRKINNSKEFDRI